MKIALLFDQPHWTGLGEYAILLYDLLSKNVEDVKLIYMGAVEDNHPYYTKMEYLRRTKIWPLRPTIIRRNYKKIADDHCFKDYVFHYLGYESYPLKLRKGVFTIHDVMKEGIRDKFNLIRRGKIKEAIVSIERNRQVRESVHLSPKASAVITISNKTKTDFERMGGANSTTIYHWIAKYKFQQRNKEEAMSTLNLDPKNKYFLSVGNDRPNKRTDLIKKFASYLPENFRLIKIGAPIDSCKSINVGTVESEQYPLFFNCSEAYLHLSEDEGFGRPLIEAMASSLPVICRENEINNELLGQAALYLRDQFTQDDIIKIVHKLSNNSYVEILQEKITKRKELYTAGEALNAYLNVYKNIPPE